jgi:hypothetical protein
MKEAIEGKIKNKKSCEAQEKKWLMQLNDSKYKV